MVEVLKSSQQILIDKTASFYVHLHIYMSIFKRNKDQNFYFCSAGEML